MRKKCQKLIKNWHFLIFLCRICIFNWAKPNLFRREQTQTNYFLMKIYFLIRQLK